MMSLHPELEKSLRIKMFIRCAATAALILGLYLLARALDLQAGAIKLLAAAAILVLLFAVFPNRVKKRGWAEALPFLLLYTAIIIRVMYMLYTPWYIRVNDVDNAELDATGFGGYLLNLIINHQLPETNDWQFYQQPLYFLISSPVSWLLNKILGTADMMNKLVDGAKTVSCICSCAAVYGADLLFDLCGTDRKHRWILTGCVGFLPACIISGGKIGIDAMTMLMCLLMIVETLFWYAKQDLKHTVILAITCGLAVLTKVSCGVIAVYTAAVMLTAFIRSKHKWKKAGQYALFACISLPLGLWYSYRNYTLFGQTLLHVPEISETNTLYCGDRSVFSRIFSIDLNSLIKTPYAHPREQFNLPVYLLKSALFGEYTYENVPTLLSSLILLLGCCLAVLALIAIVRTLIGGGRLSRQFSVLAVLYMILSAAFFLKHPFGCSQDFRYYLITGLFAAFTITLPDQNKGKEVHLISLSCLMGTFVFCVLMFFMFI